ncbi:MAG: AcrB/AcrD/AcrF family protein, partial [Sphingomicrobium sp.]
REARPVYRHGAKIATLIVALPITGLFGWALIAWRARADRDRLRRVLAALAPALAAAVLLLWQTRTGPAAQMMAIPGAAAIVWVLVPLALASRFALVRVLGPVAATLIGLGAIVPLISDALPGEKKTKRDLAIFKANRDCATLWALRPIARQPKGMVFSFVDFGPRLITVTHHSAVIGPYHRNGEAIGDVMKAFRGSAGQARTILAKYRADYLLVCPNSSTTTIFMAEAPKGFYGQLERGQVPDWLEPVTLPGNSPFRLWRVRR